MANMFHRAAASLVLKRFPGLMYYASDRNARSNLKIAVQKSFIDIFERDGDRGIRIARGTSAYTRDMITFFEYYFNSAEPVTAEGRRIVDFSTPRYHNITGFADFPVLCPSMTEPYATTEQYLDFAKLSEGDIVFDLGGYSGLTSIAFSKAVGPTGKVVTLEPDPANFAAAAKNIALHSKVNGLGNIDLLPFAVSAERGFMRLAAEGSMGSADAAILGNHRGKIVEVEMLTLDDLMERCQLAKVNFIKVDIEGSELGLITASGEFLRRYRPKLIIEPHVVDGVSTEMSIKEFLDGQGYECASIPQHGLTLPLVIAAPAD